MSRPRPAIGNVNGGNRLSPLCPVPDGRVVDQIPSFLCRIIKQLHDLLNDMVCAPQFHVIFHKYIHHIPTLSRGNVDFQRGIVRLDIFQEKLPHRLNEHGFEGQRAVDINVLQ